MANLGEGGALLFGAKISIPPRGKQNNSNKQTCL